MENEKLKALAAARMEQLLAAPEIAGDCKKALFAACVTTEGILEQVGKEVNDLLPEAPKPTKRPNGRPKAEDNPIRISVKETGYIAAIWAKYYGITNAKEAAEKYLRRLLGTVPSERLVKNLQRRISDARRDKKNNYLN